MSRLRGLLWAAVPGVTAVWLQQYRQALRELEGYVPGAPILPGSIHPIPTRWGTASYRMIQGDPALAPLLLVHGWGRTGDSAWWPLAWQTDRSLIIVDLPGHGRSRLDERFSFTCAAEAVELTLEHAQIDRPVAVGHSMGGAVLLETIRRRGSHFFDRVVMLATSAYWVRPRLWVTLAAAPIVMGPRSPVLIRRQRAEIHDSPEVAHRIAWEYASRPDRRVLDETARLLRSFDARTWPPFDVPRGSWVITANDGVIRAHHQRASAAFFGLPTIEIDAEHAVVTQAPAKVLDAIEETIGGRERGGSAAKPPPAR